MFIKRALSILLAMALLVTAVSCASSSSGSESLESGGSKELSMYIMDYDTTTKKAIEKFNETHKEVQIKAKSLVSFPADNLRSRLMYEFNNGKGPDIILCEDDTLPNLSVFFGKGSFYDLNTLISNDKSFKQSDYFKKVLEYGVYKDKRYVIPLSFKIDSMYTTKEVLDKSGVGIDGKNTGLDAFTEAAVKYMDTTNGQGKYFVTKLDFCNIAQTAAAPFFDLEKKTASFESKEFIDLLNKYKLVADGICPTLLTVKREDANNLLPGGKTVFLNEGTMNPRYATESYRAFKSEIDPVIIASPSGDESMHVIAKPERYIGISSKCGNVKAAYEFIKLMMSVKYQDIDVMEGIPVNREAYEQAKNNCLKKMKGYDAWQSGGCRNESTLKKIYSQQDSLIEKVDRFTTTDVYVNAIIKDKLAGFLAGSTTAEDTAKAIQQEIQNYLKNGIMNPEWETRQSELNKPRTGKEIKIYYSFWQEHIPKAIDEYKEKYKSEDVIGELQTQTFPEVMTKTETEIMAGVGPDLIFFRKYYFNSTRKVISTGAFYPLDDMVKADDSFNTGDYYQKVLDAGVYNGKRYFFPLFFNYSPFETTKEALERNNIKIDYSNWTWSQLHDIAMKFGREHKGSYFFNTNFSFMGMVTQSGLKFVDYEKKTCNFNTPEFRKLIGFYKDFVPLILPESKAESNINMFKHRSCVLSSGGMVNPPDISYEYKFMLSEVNENLVVVPKPSYFGERHIYISADDCIGINSTCKNKEVAYNFIKVLLSDGIQSAVKPDGYMVCGPATPINKKGYKLSFDNWLHTYLDEIPKDALNFVDNNADKFEYSLIDDEAIFNIIDESVNSYVGGNKSLDEAVREINDKVGIFLNE